MNIRRTVTAAIRRRLALPGVRVYQEWSFERAPPEVHRVYGDRHAIRIRSVRRMRQQVVVSMDA